MDRWCTSHVPETTAQWRACEATPSAEWRKLSLAADTEQHAPTARSKQAAGGIAVAHFRPVGRGAMIAIRASRTTRRSRNPCSGLASPSAIDRSIDRELFRLLAEETAASLRLRSLSGDRGDCPSFFTRTLFKLLNGVFFAKEFL